GSSWKDRNAAGAIFRLFTLLGASMGGKWGRTATKSNDCCTAAQLSHPDERACAPEIRPPQARRAPLRHVQSARLSLLRTDPGGLARRQFRQPDSGGRRCLAADRD